MIFKLRTKPTQFTKGKTQETLCDLTKRYILNKTEDYHLIDIVVTNNSLQETEQWKLRTDLNFKPFCNITIDILSSKSDSYNNIDKYISYIARCKKDELPNILIVCYHKKRVCDDLFFLFESLNNIKNNIMCHISFDEPDANLGVTSIFLKKIKFFENIITGILFITATPIKEFWDTLSKYGINKLYNINYENIHFEEDLQNYRSFEEHNIIEHNNLSTNPLEYIDDVFKHRLIDESKKK